MRDPDDTQTNLVAQLLDEFYDLGLDGHIQSRGWFIGDQHGRITSQRHGNHHPLAHSSGKLVRIIPKTL